MPAVHSEDETEPVGAVLAEAGPADRAPQSQLVAFQAGFLPNLAAHAEADEEHGDMFLPVLAEFGSGYEEKILDSARESMELYGLFRFGVALAMEAV